MKFNYWTDHPCTDGCTWPWNNKMIFFTLFNISSEPTGVKKPTKTACLYYTKCQSRALSSSKDVSGSRVQPFSCCQKTSAAELPLKVTSGSRELTDTHTLNTHFLSTCILPLLHVTQRQFAGPGYSIWDINLQVNGIGTPWFIVYVWNAGISSWPVTFRFSSRRWAGYKSIEPLLQ